MRSRTVIVDIEVWSLRYFCWALSDSSEACRVAISASDIGSNGFKDTDLSEQSTGFSRTEAEAFFRGLCDATPAALRLLDVGGFDIVWSALYHITENDRFIGSNNGGTWAVCSRPYRR